MHQRPDEGRCHLMKPLPQAVDSLEFSTMILSKERCFQFSMAMVVGFIGLQHLIQTFKQERPKFLKGAKVSNGISSVESGRRNDDLDG